MDVPLQPSANWGNRLCPTDWTPGRAATRRSTSWKNSAAGRFRHRRSGKTDAKLIVVEWLRGMNDQNNNFRPISPTRGAVWVPRIFPKLPLVNVVLGLPSTG